MALDPPRQLLTPTQSRVIIPASAKDSSCPGPPVLLSRDHDLATKSDPCFQSRSFPCHVKYEERPGDKAATLNTQQPQGPPAVKGPADLACWRLNWEGRPGRQAPGAWRKRPRGSRVLREQLPQEAEEARSWKGVTR